MRPSQPVSLQDRSSTEYIRHDMTVFPVARAFIGCALVGAQCRDLGGTRRDGSVR